MKKKHGKKYLEVTKLIDPNKEYSLEEAIDLLIKTSITKFDASCEMHLNLAVDPKFADQMVRSMVSLPHGIGKEVRVIAFVTDDKVKSALAAGAVKAGLDDLMEEVTKGFLDFDVAVATPDVMKNLGKIAKVLGPKGLMPNIKSGTVTEDVTKTIEEMKKGKIEFKTDKQGIVHSIFGKVSFGKEKLLENANALLKAVLEAKPSGVKGTYIKSIFLTTTMGPSVKITLPKRTA
jgi:large subunit ribosomal protein L1